MILRLSNGVETLRIGVTPTPAVPRRSNTKRLGGVMPVLTVLQAVGWVLTLSRLYRRRSGGCRTCLYRFLSCRIRGDLRSFSGLYSI